MTKRQFIVCFSFARKTAFKLSFTIISRGTRCPLNGIIGNIMKRKKALVAEDNDEHFKMFKSYLEEMSLDVEREAFGDDALKKLLNSDYDVAIIDVELPKLNGREIVKAVRRAKPFLPIIVVSAFAGVHGEAECINLGADDFIEKRFNKDTFQARVKRAMWHGSVANAKKTAVWRGISVNISEHSVHYRKTPMQLSDKEFNILLALVNAQGKSVCGDILEKAAWGDINRTSIRLELKIKALRDKFAALGAPRDIIDTNRGFGYALRDC